MRNLLLWTALVFTACGTRSVGSGQGADQRDVAETATSEIPWHPGDVGGDSVVPGKTTVSQIQASDSSVNCTTDGISTPAKGLSIADVVVVSPRFVASWDKNTGQPKLHGYWVAEAGIKAFEPYKGILLIVDAGADTNFPMGRVLALTADYTEYYCLSELKATAWTELGDAAVPEPLLLDDLTFLEGGGDASKAEPYEGVIVTIKDVAVTQTTASDGKGWFEVGNGIQVVNDFGISWKPTKGAKIAALTGAIKYHFGKYRLAPRFIDDIVLKEEVAEPSPEIIEGDAEVVHPKITIYDIQSSDSSTNCTTEGNVTVEKGIEIGPVVVTTPLFSAASTLDGFYVSDFPVGGDVSFTGIMVVISKDAQLKIAPGDEVIIKGDYKEYYCLSEIFASSVTVTGAQPPPSPYVLKDPTLLENGGGPMTEPYEGVLITLQGLEVTATSSSDGKGWFRVGNGIEVLNDFKVDFTPALGQKLKSISGVVKYHWGKYRLVPRYASDIVEEGAITPEPTPDVAEPGPDAAADAGGEQKKTILQIQASQASVDCTANADVTVAQSVALADVVVVSPRHDVSASLHGYYIQDPVTSWPYGSDGKYTGTLMVVAKSLNTNFQQGDLVSVVGDYKEYYCMTEIVATSAQKVGTAPVPQALEAQASWFEQGGTVVNCEPYEGLRVTIADVQVTNTTGGTQPKWWFQAGNGIYVTDFFGLKDQLALSVGQGIKRLTGAVYYSWGKYLLVPFTTADIELQ